VNTQSSGLSLCMPSLLENPLTFFTNTCHPSQRYHLSFSTKKDCIFSNNTVVNIDVAPHLPVCHIITHLVRVGVNTSILILIVSILLYVLQASLIVYAIWQAYSTTSGWNFNLTHGVAPRHSRCLQNHCLLICCHKSHMWNAWKDCKFCEV
jgi:hypothetical protein